MEKRKIIKSLLVASLVLLNGMFFTSCEDPYSYNNPGEEPPRSLLAASVYDYLEEQGNFKRFLSIADSVSVAGGGYYSDVLKKTGSKTVFVANDEVFDNFFNSDNVWNVTKFEQLSEAQKRMILFFGMIDDAYTLDMLASLPGSNGSSAVAGEVMRKTSSLGMYDSIPFEKGDALPNNDYWTRFKENGVHILKDNSTPTLVYFMQSFLDSKNITDEDISTVVQRDRKYGDAFIFNIAITEPDKFCKNGYVNEVDQVLLPRENMAEYIKRRSQSEDESVRTSRFNSFLERFCAPYYDEHATNGYKDLNNAFTDSIFVKRFFTGDDAEDPYKKKVLSLPFDPGKNNYAASGQSVESNIAAMFVPTDKALREYFENGEGAFLKARYKEWDSVPDNVILDLVANHMKPSFVLAVPSKFDKLEDKMGTSLGASVDDIVDAYVCGNGVVYVVDKVYPPTEYIAVSAPVSLSANTKIFKWAIDQNEFNLYLLSMEEGNTFNFFVPTDDVLYGSFDEVDGTFYGYTNPAAKANGKTENWQFYYNEKTSAVNVLVRDELGDSIKTITAAGTISKVLLDFLDNNIIVGDISKDIKYYQTKGRGTIKVDVKNLDKDKPSENNIIVESGRNIEVGNPATLTESYYMNNGNTFFVTEVLQPPLKSVYDILSDEENYPQYSKFFELCAAAKQYKIDTGSGPKNYAGPIFIADGAKSDGTGNGNANNQIVAFFNTYHYTVYVPTNEALTKALDPVSGFLKSWEEIDLMDESDEKGQAAQDLYEFLRYHFQDNSIYVGNGASAYYETALLNTVDKKFRKLRVIEDGSGLSLYSEGNEEFSKNTPSVAKRSAYILSSNPYLYNVMARDHQTTTSEVNTTSFAVIHLISDVLNFKK